MDTGDALANDPLAWTRADRKCGADRVFRPAPEAPAIPDQAFAPSPLLMGRAGGLTAPGEALLPRYFALQERRTSGLLCAPSRECGGAVVALYASPVDAALARKDWFQRAFSEALCPEDFRDVVRVREVSQASALATRRREAEARGEDWPASVPVPQPFCPASRRVQVVPPLRGYWTVFVLAFALAVLAFVHWLR